MSGNPVNLGQRFLLELTALAAASYWGWTYFAGPLGIVSAVVFPVAAAVLWGTFAVPNDPSRSGSAPVAVPGAARIVLELAFFALPALGLYTSGATQLSILFSSVVLVHYVVSYDRVIWLIGR